MNRAGYVLVGGCSSRMGCDKALRLYRGAPLAASVASAVEQAAGSAVLVGDPDLYCRLGFPVTPDLYPGEGPLGGILTALEHSVAPWNLVTACDMPALTADFLRMLLEAAGRANADALVPSGPSGLVEPLCAIYHSRALPVLRGAFARGVRKVADALAETRAAVFPIAEAKWFQNVNTPEEWTAYAG